MLLFFITLILTILKWYEYTPKINFDNFRGGLKMYAWISSMHSLPDNVLMEFARKSTKNTQSNANAYAAMHWINRMINRSPCNKWMPESWKFNIFWKPELGTRHGYRLLHKAYHMFDGMTCPRAPVLYMSCHSHRYDTYVCEMQMYTTSRRIIVKLRALMNIVHFGSYVDEGFKHCKYDRVMHRSALLEVLNESEKLPRKRESLQIHCKNVDNRIVYWYQWEPMWRVVS